MNDYIEYMNSLSATTSTNEQAQNAYQSMINYKDQLVQAKDDYKQQFAIIPELITGASGEYILKGLGEKAISLLTDTAKSAVQSAVKTTLKNAGVDEATAEATASDLLSGNVGNIANRIASGASDVVSDTANTLRNIGADALEQVQGGGDIASVLSSATEQATSVVQNLAGQAQGAISGVGDIVSQGASLGTNVATNIVSKGISATSNVARDGYSYLDQWSEDFGSAERLQTSTLQQLTSGGAKLPQEVEMTDFSSLPSSTSASTTATAEAGAEAGAEVATEAGADVGATVAEVAGAEVATESAGLALDATGVLAPIGAIVGLVGGLLGFLGLEKRDPLPTPPPMPAILNPSVSFGT